MIDLKDIEQQLEQIANEPPNSAKPAEPFRPFTDTQYAAAWDFIAACRAYDGLLTAGWALTESSLEVILPRLNLGHIDDQREHLERYLARFEAVRSGSALPERVAKLTDEEVSDAFDRLWARLKAAGVEPHKLSEDDFMAGFLLEIQG